MSSTMIDAIVIVILVLSTIFAWSRGLVREALSLLGWIIALIVAGQFAYTLVPLIEGIPAVSSLVESCQIMTAMSFVIIFIIMIVIMALVTPFISDMIKNSRIGLFNAALGGFFGFLRGLIIVLMVFIVYDTFLAASFDDFEITDATSYKIFESPRNNLQSSIPSNEDLPNWFYNQFLHVTRHCETPSTPDA